jgi:hypothetical protein
MAPKYDLNLLKNPDGSWMHDATPEIVAQVLHLSLRQVRNRVARGTLVSEGSHGGRRILVSSIRAYRPYGTEQRSATSKASWDKLTPDEQNAFVKKGAAKYWAGTTLEDRSSIAKARWEKLPPEQQAAGKKARSAGSTAKQRAEWARKAGKASWDKLTSEEHSARVKKCGAKQWDNTTPEQRSSIAASRWAKKTPEERSAIHRARLANYTPAKLSAIAKKGAKTRLANSAPEERTARAKKAAAGRFANSTPEQRSAWARKGAPARLAKSTSEQRSERAQKAVKTKINRNPDVYKALGRRTAARWAEIKATKQELLRLKALVENGAAATKTSKEPSPKRQAAAAFHADWVRAGRPSSGDDIVELAKPYYPKKVSWSEQYPSRRQARREKIIRAFKELFRRQQNKIAAGARN